MKTEKNNSAILKSLMGEYVKTYTEFDISGRAHKVYQTMSDAKHGQICLVTEYAYQGLTSIIVGTKETEGAWNSAWDAIFTV